MFIPYYSLGSAVITLAAKSKSEDDNGGDAK
jgi:hypothetical protein